MVAVLELRDYVSDSSIVVPTLIIKQDFKGSYTYIVNGSDSIQRAEKVYVQTGVVNNNMTEITGGLTPGMRVISEGFDQVVDGSAVKI
jgi:multidrug efflux pump subunit AcrA (membrane-fusion protein)